MGENLVHTSLHNIYIKRSGLLLLDEATSALDSASEHEVLLLVKQEEGRRGTKNLQTCCFFLILLKVMLHDILSAGEGGVGKDNAWTKCGDNCSQAEHNPECRCDCCD